MLTRKGKASNRGVWLLAMVGVAFTAYAGDIGGAHGWIDTWFSNLNGQAHGYNDAVVRTSIAVFPYVATAMFLAVFYFVVLPRRVAGKKMPVEAGVMTIHDFADRVRVDGVGARVAREAYRLIVPLLGTKLDDKVCENLMSLGLTEGAVADLQRSLMVQADRVGVVAKAPGESLLAIMQAVERCPARPVAVMQARREVRVESTV